MKYEAIINLLVTKDDVDRLLACIDEFEQELNKKGNNFESLTRKVIPPTWQEAFHTTCQTDKIDTSSPVKVAEFFKDLKDAIEKIPIMTVTLAIEPDISVTANLARWLKSLPHKYVVTFKKDEAIVSGAIVAVNGYYKDYSARNQFTTLIGAT